MSLSEFINYRSVCPMCGENLVTYFFAKSKRPIKYEENRIVIMLDMFSLLSGRDDYMAGLSLDMDNNSFYVEFFNKDGKKFDDATQLHLINKFKSFSENLGNLYSFYKKCMLCRGYSSSTSEFSFDFKTSTFSEIDIDCESFNFIIPMEDEDRFVVLDNYYSSPSGSVVYFWRQRKDRIKPDWLVPDGCSKLDLPLIQFISQKETLKRLNLLLTFY
jgi:hypothetical protein